MTIISPSSTTFISLDALKRRGEKDKETREYNKVSFVSYRIKNNYSGGNTSY